MISSISWIVGIILFLFIKRNCAAHAVDPVYPCYNRSLIPTFYKKPLISDDAPVSAVLENGAARLHESLCLTHTKDIANSKNGVVVPLNENDLKSNLYLPNTTYWYNEYLHVGHFFYDIVLMEIMKTQKINRIVMQRVACFATQCMGIGSIESFYKGYFAALFKAFDQPNIPVYIRYGWKEHDVKPEYYSADGNNYYGDADELLKHEPLKKITLAHITCFEKVYRSGSTNYGDTPNISPKAVQAFKAAAYNMTRSQPPLTTYFLDDRNGSVSLPPKVILIAYRGRFEEMKVTRVIENLDELVHEFKTIFPYPEYEIRLLNTGNIRLDFKTQLEEVARAHVVITTHGAFEANMIYMRNSSLLVELFGVYGVREVYTFHRLALTFGLYYARLNMVNFIDHLIPGFNLTSTDIQSIMNVTRDYFDRKAYHSNLSPIVH